VTTIIGIYGARLVPVF